MRKLASIVLAAGDGKRLKSKLPKALHKVCGKPMLQHILEVLRRMEIESIAVVVGYASEHIESFLGGDAKIRFVHQAERKGTGHAVSLAAPLFQDWHGDVLVLNGDCPLIREDSLRTLVERHHQKGAAASILTATLDDPTGYGRVLRSEADDVLGIVEDRDCNRYERKIQEINAGFYCFQSAELFAALRQLRPNNDQAELYLTDVIQILVRAGKRVEAYMVPDASETFGINNRVQLATAEGILRRRIMERHMHSGVTIIQPETTCIDDGVVIGQDTDILPFTMLEGSCSIGSDCVIGPAVRLIDCVVGAGARVSHVVLQGQTINAQAVIQGDGALLSISGATVTGAEQP